MRVPGHESAINHSALGNEKCQSWIKIGRWYEVLIPPSGLIKIAVSAVLRGLEPALTAMLRDLHLAL